MLSYLVFAKIDSDIITKEYGHHREAYDMYYSVVSKLKKRLNKIEPNEEGRESTTNGYDKMFECSLGIVSCGEISDDLKI